jgi:hypothetical protein
MPLGLTESEKEVWHYTQPAACGGEKTPDVSGSGGPWRRPAPFVDAERLATPCAGFSFILGLALSGMLRQSAIVFEAASSVCKKTEEF